MILDLDEFIRRERPSWTELDEVLEAQAAAPDREMSFEEVQRFHYLYQRASSDLVKMNTFAAHADLQAWLENLVARAYASMHEERGRSTKLSIWLWFKSGFPSTVRRRWRALSFAIAVCLLGGVLGAVISVVSPEVKVDLLGGFAPLAGDPSARVAREEAEDFDFFSGRQSFSSQLMVNNIRVTVLAMVAGISFGVVTVIILFQNGVLLGIVICDYIRAGEGEFLTAWLLPHGSFELPAIFLGGAAGLVLARAMFGWGTELVMRERLRRVMPDLLSMVGGAALLLVWAALVEAFLSQYHSPELYPWKISVGAVQLAALIFYLGFCGRSSVRGGGRKGTIMSVRDGNRSGFRQGGTELEIRTPDGVSFSLPLASPVIRALALMIDLLAIGALSKLVQTMVQSLAVVSVDLAESLMLISQVVLVVFLLMFLEWIWRGQTLGKRMFGLRVVDERGLSLKPGQIVMRNLFRLLDMLPGVFLVGGVAAVCSSRCQRLGDLAAGTLVIRERKISEPDLDALSLDAVNSFRKYPHLESRLRQRVTPAEGRLALDALMRREKFEAAERLRIFHHLADYFREMVEFPEEVTLGMSDEQYVRDVVETVFRKRVTV